MARFGLLVFVLPALCSCVELPLYHDAGPDLAEHYAMCLAPDRPGHSPQLTDCVLARYEASLREEERVRAVTEPSRPRLADAMAPPGER